MNLSPRSVNVITLFADDLAGTKSFYQKVFELPLIWEDENSAVFRLENMMINLLDVSAAPELIAPGEVASSDAGSRFVFTVDVDDVDAACAQLAGHGVTLLNGPMDRPWGRRTASFTDPAGHIWEFAKDLPPAEGQDG
jgi:catechol 2,3-dioxygenase-like lactoylglutathione lyase family enzyme